MEEIATLIGRLLYENYESEHAELARWPAGRHRSRGGTPLTLSDLRCDARSD